MPTATSSSDDRSPDEWERLYRDQRSHYETFANKTKSLLEELLADAGIDVVQVEARAKDPVSFTAKLMRRPGSYLDPLKDMLDLAGVRVVAYYLSDVAKIGTLIEREFTVDSEKSWRRETTQEVDRFGYVSDHFIVSCSSTREKLSEWRPYSNYYVEVQVRTVLQHAWAAIDHKLAYKRESDVPWQLQRQLSRLSALLEVGDEQFEAARAASTRLDATYDVKTRSGELNLPVDVASLHAYLSDNLLVQSFIRLATSIGFTFESESGDIGELVIASHRVGFFEIAELDRFLTSSDPWVRRALETMWAKRPRELPWRISVPFLLSCLVWIGNDIALDSVQEFEEADDFFVKALVAAREAI